MSEQASANCLYQGCADQVARCLALALRAQRAKRKPQLTPSTAAAAAAAAHHRSRAIQAEGRGEEGAAGE